MTAQKRSQAVNSVGISINAVSGQTLAERHITSVGDLTKLVPGFVYTPSNTSTPVYFIRGIGFNDSSLASSPAVSVYLDETPIPFPIMATGVSMDLERVEVLKGPQGTLFGENSTGGAINYIAAKPTDTFQAGGDFTLQRFGEVKADGFVSGPLSSTLDGRFSFMTDQGGAWQKSQTRDATLGASNLTGARLLLAWHPSEKLKVNFSLNGFVDHSDTQAAQLISIAPANPALLPANIATAPLAPNNNRAADWSPTDPNRNNNFQIQTAVRVDYTLSDEVVLTSLSSFDNMRILAASDLDGMVARQGSISTDGNINVWNQEVRLTGTTPTLNWIVGGNYEHDSVNDRQSYELIDSSANQPLALVPGFSNIPPFFHTFGTSDQRIDTWAVFGNTDYKITHNLTAQAGIRYTSSDRNSLNCAGTTDANNGLGQLFVALQEFAGKTSPILVQPGQCVTENLQSVPIVNPYKVTLDEQNVSWHLGLNYKFDQGALLYGNVSQGFKAGAVPTVAVSSIVAFKPARQEEVTAYEVGVKTPLWERRIQLNAAAFYYDYKNKQLRTQIDDPTFGLLETISNVPKSRVWGLEGDVVARPIPGLTLTGGLTYLDSKIDGPYTGFNLQLQDTNFEGSDLPYTPKVEGNADVQYEWSLANGLRPFVGATLTYHSKTNATFAVPGASADLYRIRSYTLLDLRAGFASPDNAWRLTAFVNNATNAFYYYSAYPVTDVAARLAGRPLVFGATVNFKIR